MNFGYKTLLALTLATAACWKAKAQSKDVSNTDKTELKNQKSAKEDSVAIANFKIAEVENVSNYTFNAKGLSGEDHKAETPDFTGVQRDSILQEEIYQSILEIEHDLLRFMALSEDIKFIAYRDCVTGKMTIANGLTTLGGYRVRNGNRIKSEEQMISETRYKIKKEIVPQLAKYLPDFPKLANYQRLVLLDMFWNNGAGAGVLTNGKEKNAYWASLSEKQKQEIADSIKSNNVKVAENGHIFSLNDLPEWRNLGVGAQSNMTSLYSNNNIVKGEHVNLNFAEKWRNLDQKQRLEVCELLEKQKTENAFLPSMPQKWNNQQVNDSTIRYQGYVAEDEYSFADIPQWYKLNETQQEAVAKKMAQQNNYVVHNGHKISVRDIQAWYFLSEKDKNAVQKKFKGMDLFKQNPKTKKTKPILSGLCCELNLYLAERTPENLERVSARIASFVHSGKSLVSGLLKRANLRAKIFSGEIEINGEGANSLNLDSIKLSSIYSTKVNDLNNPEKYCDTLNNFKIGRNYADTIEYEQSRVSRIPQGFGKNSGNRKNPQIRKRFNSSHSH